MIVKVVFEMKVRPGILLSNNNNFKKLNEKSQSPRLHTVLFIYITFLKSQNCRSRGQINGYQCHGTGGTREEAVAIKEQQDGSL